MKRKNHLIYVLIIICLLAAGAALLPGTDFIVLVTWELVMLSLGVAVLPLAEKLFAGFADGGWIFSKALGLAAGGYFTWVLVCAGAIPFGRTACFGVTGVVAAVCWGWYAISRKKSTRTPEMSLSPILLEETIFLALMLFWIWTIGFRPEAYGTEKYMDYGFIAAICRSSVLPARDIWHATDAINYYYGGQYFTAYLIKLSGTSVAYGYNAMRALTASLAGVLPFALVRQLLDWHFRSSDVKHAGAWSVAGGVVGLAAVSLAGNLHYVLYGLFGKVFRLSGYEDYWFPQSTRYIGHNPENDDQCIHEFPSYSSILGDLHAHYINLIFVLLFLGILVSWMLREREKIRRFKTAAGAAREPGANGQDHVPDGSVRAALSGGVRETLSLPVVAMAVLDGMFRFTNYWDFVIYLTVFLIACLVLAFIEARGGRGMQAVLTFLLRMIAAAGIGYIAALPFSLSFTSPVSQVAGVFHQTPFYQFAILWGLPIVTAAVFALTRFLPRERRKNAEASEKKHRIDMPTVIVLMLSVCAVGLVLIPEFVYVRDIYEETSARANTMFKLTYQAFVMFGLMFGYALILMVSEQKKARRIPGLVLLGVFALTVGYFPYSVSCWFGNITNAENRFSLDAEAFADTMYPDDTELIDWLNENVRGNPVVLECFGDSYSNNCRISALTGLPTVEGWYVHEWLWRGNPEEQNERIVEVTEIYTSTDEERVKELIRKYHISYIAVGSCERQEFDALNDDLLRSLGTVVCETDGSLGTSYLVDVTDIGGEEG